MGSGTGLLGVRQRVDLVDGTLVAGPTDDGGFVLDAILPACVPTTSHAASTRTVEEPLMSPDPIRVLVVDDEPMVCAHLRTILGSAGDIDVIEPPMTVRPRCAPSNGTARTSS